MWNKIQQSNSILQPSPGMLSSSHFESLHQSSLGVSLGELQLSQTCRKRPSSEHKASAWTSDETLRLCHIFISHKLSNTQLSMGWFISLFSLFWNRDIHERWHRFIQGSFGCMQTIIDGSGHVTLQGGRSWSVLRHMLKSFLALFQMMLLPPPTPFYLKSSHAKYNQAFFLDALSGISRIPSSLPYFCWIAMWQEFRINCKCKKCRRDVGQER